MSNKDKSKAELIEELTQARGRIADLENALAGLGESEGQEPSPDAPGSGADPQDTIKEAFKATEDQLRVLVEITGDALYRLRYESMEYDYISPGFQSLTGYRPDQVTQGSFAEMVLEIEAPGGEPLSRDFIKDMRLAGKTGEFKADYLIETKSGQKIWLSDHSFPWLNQDGEVIGSVGILTDITERKAVEKERESLISGLRQNQALLKRLSIRDALTGLANQHHFNEMLYQEWNRAVRDAVHLGVITMRIDLFEQFNENYGHVAGEYCLKLVGGALKRSLRRPGDLAARFQDDFFAALLPNTNLSSIKAVVERVKQAVADLDIIHQDGINGDRVTVSLGVASAHYAQYHSPESLFTTAEWALSMAQEAGGNRAHEASGPKRDSR